MPVHGTVHSNLGYVIDSKGLQLLPEKVEASYQAPTPSNITELKSYLRLLTYYRKFLPNLWTLLALLYKLLSKTEPWTSVQDEVFNESKELRPHNC